MENRNYRKPIIGILPSIEPSNSMTKVNFGYTDGVIRHGGIPFIFTFVKEKDDMKRLVDMCDGLIFIGGVDPDPAIYGEEIINDTVDISVERDELEFPVLEMAMKQDKPILGICRGIQAINIGMGGTLYQDIPAQLQKSEDEKVIHAQKDAYPVGGHKIKILQGTPLYDIFGKDEAFVNTHHHQAVKDLAPGFEVMAMAQDGIAEAIYMKERPYVFGVQWHPELIWQKHSDSDKIFQYFIKCVKDKMN